MRVTRNGIGRSAGRLAGLGLLVVLALGACQSATLTNERRALGIIVLGDGEPMEVVDAPASALAGVPFDLSIHTFALTDCTMLDETQIEVEGSVATIRPFNITRQEAGTECSTVIVELVHQGELAFDAAGEATIRVEGRRVSGNQESPVTFEQTITIE